MFIEIDCFGHKQNPIICSALNILCSQEKRSEICHIFRKSVFFHLEF